MYTGCHCPVTAGQKGGGVWEMDIRDPPWAQANFPPPLGKGGGRVRVHVHICHVYVAYTYTRMHTYTYIFDFDSMTT